MKRDERKESGEKKQKQKIGPEKIHNGKKLTRESIKVEKKIHYHKVWWCLDIWVALNKKNKIRTCENVWKTTLFSTVLSFFATSTSDVRTPRNLARTWHICLSWVTKKIQIFLNLMFTEIRRLGETLVHHPRRRLGETIVRRRPDPLPSSFPPVHVVRQAELGWCWGHRVSLCPLLG